MHCTCTRSEAVLQALVNPLSLNPLLLLLDLRSDRCDSPSGALYRSHQVTDILSKDYNSTWEYKLFAPTSWSRVKWVKGTQLEGLHSPESLAHIHNLRPFNYDAERTDPVTVAQRNALEFVIEQVLDHRGNRAKWSTMQFLIRWSGFGYESDSWEPYKTLIHRAAASLSARSHNEGIHPFCAQVTTGYLKADIPCCGDSFFRGLVGLGLNQVSPHITS